MPTPAGRSARTGVPDSRGGPSISGGMVVDRVHIRPDFRPRPTTSPRLAGPENRPGADRLHPYAHHRQAGHRARPFHRAGLQHGPVSVTCADRTIGPPPAKRVAGRLLSAGDLGRLDKCSSPVRQLPDLERFIAVSRLCQQTMTLMPVRATGATTPRTPHYRCRATSQRMKALLAAKASADSALGWAPNLATTTSSVGSIQRYCPWIPAP